MESGYTILVFVILVLLVGVPYWVRAVARRKHTESALERNVRGGLHQPATLHPKIDLLKCIGCGSCVHACPEDVLGIVDGRAAIINGVRCISHALCVDACPVGAIAMGFGTPKQGMEIPLYDEHFETNIPGLYIVGELGGVGLIRNAFEQSIKAVDHLARMVRRGHRNEFDLIIVGAGPAGLGAALTAKERGLRYVLLEQYDLGGSILHYPRKKLVLTSPVAIPLYGKLKASEISKEELLEMFGSITHRFGINLHPNSKVDTVTKEAGGFSVQSGTRSYNASHVLLALGRRGTPKKLNVPGEELSKVSYRLIEAEKYTNSNLLVVGGGDSAIEAAVALARQQGNSVTLSYRRDAFVRLREKNEQAIAGLMKSGKSKIIFNSEVTEILPDAVVIRQSENIIHKTKNDFIFIFAGGELPGDFLKKIGVQMRSSEVPSKAA